MYDFHSFDQSFLLKRNMTEVKSYSMVSCGIKWNFNSLLCRFRRWKIHLLGRYCTVGTIIYRTTCTYTYVLVGVVYSTFNEYEGRSSAKDVLVLSALNFPL